MTKVAGTLEATASSLPLPATRFVRAGMTPLVEAADRSRAREAKQPIEEAGRELLRESNKLLASPRGTIAPWWCFIAARTRPRCRRRLGEWMAGWVVGNSGHRDRGDSLRMRNGLKALYRPKSGARRRGRYPVRPRCRQERILVWVSPVDSDPWRGTDRRVLRGRSSGHVRALGRRSAD